MGDFSPSPGGRAGNAPTQIYVAGNTTGATTSTTARTLSLSGAGIASVGISNGSILLSASSAAQTAPTISLFVVGNTTTSTSSGVNAAGALSFDGAGLVSVGVSGSSIVISATSAAQTVQTIGGVATGNTTGSSSSTTFDARSVTVSGAGDISVGYSSNNVLIISGTAPVASGTVKNLFALGNTTGQSSSSTVTLTNVSLSGAGIVSVGLSTTAAGAGIVIFSATTAAQTVQTIGGVATGNTTGSSSSTTFDARSVTVSGAGIVSVGYSSNNILIVSAPTPAASGTVVNMSAIGNTTAVSSSSSQTLTAVSFSGAGGVSIGMSTTAAGSPVLVISGATTVASGTVKNLFALGNTTGQSSSTTVTLTNVSLSGAGIVSVGFSTTGAGAGVAIFSATTAAQTVQTISGIATGNTTGSSSVTTFDARSVTVSGGGIVSVGYSSNNILIVSATSAASQGGLSFNAIGNTIGLTSSSASSIPETLTLSGAGGVSVGFSSSTIVISGATTAAQTAPTLSFSALGNTTALTTSFVDVDGALNFSGAGAASIGFSSSTIIVSVPTGVGTSTGTASAVGNTTVGASMVNTFSSQVYSGGGGISVGFSSSTMIISENNTSSFFARSINSAAAGTTTSLAAVSSLTVIGSNDIDVAFNGGSMVIANEVVSFFEPRQFSQTSTVTMIQGTMLVAPVVVTNVVSFNQLRLFVTRTSGAASLTQSTSTNSTTATASAGWNSTVSVVFYSRQGSTSSQSFASSASTVMTYGMTESWSISRTGASNSVTATLSFGYAQGTSAGLTSTFTSSASAATTTIYSFGFTAASLFTNTTSGNLLRMDIPFATSLGNGAYVLGIMGSSATATATGNSLNTAGAGNWSQTTACITFGTYTAINYPGTLQGTSNIFPGFGSTSSVGSVPATTIGWQAVSSIASNSHVYFLAAQL